MENFLQKEIENFEIFEENEQEINAERLNKRCRQWVGTWNNPKMTDEEFKEYFEELYKQELLQYATFQREQGEKTGTIHFQFYVNYKNPQYFKKVKEKLLPYGCHFAPMISTANRCIAYCQKAETRVSGPYEIGEPEIEGQRSDLAKARQMIDEGVPFEVVAKIFPNQTMQYERQLRSRERMFKSADYSERCRNVEVTYIYGNEGIGKTSHIYKKHGFSDVFFVSSYEKYLFHEYKYQKTIVFDEYDSQIKITEFNRMLDIYPLKLRALGDMIQGAYENVYIVSNKPLDKQYSDLSEDDLVLKRAFLRRIHKIIYIDDEGKSHIEKETIFRALKEDEIELPGLTRKIEKTIYYDRIGRIIKIESKEKRHQVEIFEVPVETNEELPWED